MTAIRANASTNLYTDTFENYALGTPLINGINYWYASDTNVIVQATNVAPGNTQAAMIPYDMTLSNRFLIPSPSNVWLHLEAKPARQYSTNYPVMTTNDTVLFYVDSNGYFVAYDGISSNWVTITQTVDGATILPLGINTWVTNLNVFVDYSNKTWQISRDANQLTRNFGFANTNISGLTGFDVNNYGSETNYLDNVYIYNQAPFAAYYVQPKTLSTNWAMYGFKPSTQTFDIVVTSGPGTPVFTITTNAPYNWMAVVPGAGTLTNGTNTITLNFFTNELTVGTHTAILDVVTAIGAGVTDQVTVVVTALSRPIPNISFSSYLQTISKGVQPAATNLLISNIAAPPRSGMRYDVTSDMPWLSAAPNGVCSNEEDHTIAVQFADMTTNVGSYDGILTIQTVDTNISTLYTPVGMISSTLYVNVHVYIIGVGIPTGLTASDGTVTNGVQLNWLATTNVDHYEVWRADTNILASATRIGTATNLAYLDTAINPGLKRWYWVRTINAFGGDGDFSLPDVGWRFLPASANLTASSGTYTNRIALSWAASDGAFTYEVFRGIYTNMGLAYSIASNIPATVTTYDDSGVDPIVTYYYWVRSHTPDMYNDSAMASGYRAALLTPNNISASKGTFNSKIRVLWQLVDAAVKYEIWRSPDINIGNAVRIGTVTIRGYDDTQVSANPVFYYYWIRAYNAQGLASPYSGMDVGWLQLATPANVSATQGTRPYSVRISWNPIENATSYEVVRSSNPKTAALAQSLAESTHLAAVAPSLDTGIFALSETSRTFLDDNATFAGASYLYTVRAKNALGESELSGESIGWRQVRQATTTKPVANDYDGDKLSDVVLFNTDAGLLRILCTTLGELPVAFGDASCVPVQGDYDGDGLADPMIYSAAHGYWRVMLSLANYVPPIQAAFGGPGQMAAAADYDGDGKTDPATYEAATGLFRVMLSRSGYLPPALAPLGGPGYVAASADYDDDGKADPAVYSATDGLLRVRLSTDGYNEQVVPLGGAGIIFVPGDFDGDGKSELTTYNEATGTLSVRLSSLHYAQYDLALGGPGYAWIVPADYDGDGRLDPAAYSQTDGWMIVFSSLQYSTVSDTFGGANNIPFVP